MAYVSIPNDLSKIKTKLAFNLTSRQLVCFGCGAAVGIPAFLLTRSAIGNSGAMFLMLAVMLPAFFMAMYEKDGQPLAFDLKKSIYIKAFQVRFEGAGYVSISDPHFCGPKANKNGPIRSRVKSTGANERLTNGALIVKPV